MNTTSRTTLFVVLGALFLFTAGASAEPASPPAATTSTDWPQWRGPNRDGVAPSSPKLLETWPANGSALLWKSENLPLYWTWAGCGSPVVADGKVFLYLNLKQPAGGGDEFHLITTELLTDWGWLPDLPENPDKPRRLPVWATGRPVSPVRQYALVRPARPGSDLRVTGGAYSFARGGPHRSSRWRIGP